MTTNRQFKDSVFTSLFNNPDLLRELYCALKGISLPKDTPVSINTLEKVLFLDINNDISFEIGGKLVVLIEHQSTINPNIAFRLLLYIARVLEKRIEGKTLYSKKPISIPWPEFFVLYNGKEEFPDEQVYRLSELFEKPEDLGLLEKASPLLELEAKVLNINEGRNEAIRYCYKYGILKEYLNVHGSEVLNMILYEWNTEDAIAFAREEGREEARQEKALDIARKMKNADYPLSEIADLTGLPPEIIEQIE